MPGKMVTADAQFGIARILRPWNGALSLTGPYQGQPVSTQIMLTEVLTPPGGAPLDPFAETGSAGYASNLIKGLDVPIGSRVILWLPAIQSGGLLAFRYSWSITWRLRNVYDYRNARMPFHFPKQGEGVPDTSTVPAEPRVVVPCAVQSVIYAESPEPVGLFTRTTAKIRAEDVSTGFSQLGLPFIPSPVGGTGIFQQGLADPNVNPAAPYPLYMVHEVQAVGDEMLISLFRTDAGGLSPTWDFATDDQFVGQYLGSDFPDIGVYAMVGTAP